MTTNINVQDRDEVAAQIELARSARGESEPVATRIEEERDLQTLRDLILKARQEYDLAKADLRALESSLAGSKQSD